jgi:hypothetical protein
MSNFKKVIATAVALGAASTAYATGPKVSFGGMAKGFYATRNQEPEFEGDYVKNGFIFESEFKIGVDGKTKSNLNYGAEITLYANTSDAASGDDRFNAKTGSVYLSGDFGKVELGSMYSPAKKMAISGATFAPAGEGFDGDYRYLISNDAVLASEAGFIERAVLPSVDLKVNKGSTANAIAYTTPEYMGVQAAVAYVPDTEIRGTASSFKNVLKSSPVSTFHKNLVQGALTYKGTFEGVGVQAAVVGERAEYKNEALRDLKAWEVGLAIDWMNVTFSGNYGSYGKSGQAETFANAKSSDYYSLGLAYNYQAGKVGVNYLSTKTAQNEADDFVAANGDKNNLQVVSFGADYKLAEGLMPYAELTHFKAKDAVLKEKGEKHNDGWVFVIGTKVSF